MARQVLGWVHMLAGKLYNLTSISWNPCCTKSTTPRSHSLASTNTLQWTLLYIYAHKINKHKHLKMLISKWKKLSYCSIAICFEKGSLITQVSFKLPMQLRMTLNLSSYVSTSECWDCGHEASCPVYVVLVWTTRLYACYPIICWQLICVLTYSSSFTEEAQGYTVASHPLGNTHYYFP